MLKILQIIILAAGLICFCGCEETARKNSHPQDMAGGDPGESFGEGFLVDELSRLVERFLC